MEFTKRRILQREIDELEALPSKDFGDYDRLSRLYDKLSKSYSRSADFGGKMAIFCIILLALMNVARLVSHSSNKPAAPAEVRK